MSRMIGPFAIPEIQLHLNSMKASILHAFDANFPDFREALEKNITDVLSSKEFARKLHEEVERCVTEKMKYVVSIAVHKVLEDSDIKNRIQEAVFEQVRAHFRSMNP